ncbi:hypothetical protein Tco_0506330 [Tanacetum coccineum]
MKIHNDRQRMMRRSVKLLAFHDHFEVYEFVLEQVDALLDQQRCKCRCLDEDNVPLRIKKDESRTFHKEDWHLESESDILAFDGAVQRDTFQLKKLTDIIRSRKIGMIWSLSLLGICKRCKIPFIREDGLTIIWDSENLTELCE